MSRTGQRVKAGDLLLELDPAEASADGAPRADALDASLAEIARRRFAIEDGVARRIDEIAATLRPQCGQARDAILAPVRSSRRWPPDPQDRLGATSLPEASACAKHAVLRADLDAARRRA